MRIYDGPKSMQAIICRYKRGSEIYRESNILTAVKMLQSEDILQYKAYVSRAQIPERVINNIIW